jgi:hypothetical protein
MKIIKAQASHNEVAEKVQITHNIIKNIDNNIKM